MRLLGRGFFTHYFFTRDVPSSVILPILRRFNRLPVDKARQFNTGECHGGCGLFERRVSAVHV